MATTFTDALGTATAVTITLNSLASSLTAGRQSTTITLIDGNGNVPWAVDIEVTATLTTGTLANDKALYLFASRSLDNSLFENGPPAPGATDAAFTFSNSPVGTSPLQTDMQLLGAITFNAQSEAHNKVFRLFAPTPYVTLVALNYSGIALAGSGNSIQYRTRKGDGR